MNTVQFDEIKRLIKDKHRVFRFSVYPTFGAIPMSWFIFTDSRIAGEYRNPLVVEVTGLRDEDDLTSLSNEPNQTYPIKFRHLLLNADQTQQIRKGQSLTIRPIPISDHRGLDGTIRSVEWFQGFSTLKIYWWENGPDEWREFTTWAEETCHYLSKLLDRYNSPRMKFFFPVE